MIWIILIPYFMDFPLGCVVFIDVTTFDGENKSDVRRMLIPFSSIKYVAADGGHSAIFIKKIFGTFIYFCLENIEDIKNQLMLKK